MQGTRFLINLVLVDHGGGDSQKRISDGGWSGLLSVDKKSLLILLSIKKKKVDKPRKGGI